MTRSQPSEARIARLSHSHARRGTDHALGSARRVASKKEDRRTQRRRLEAALRADRYHADD